MNAGHRISTHPPNPPFQPTPRECLPCSFRLLPRGRLNGGVRHISQYISIHFSNNLLGFTTNEICTAIRSLHPFFLRCFWSRK